jgi:hypothetical protein
MPAVHEALLDVLQNKLLQSSFEASIFAGFSGICQWPSHLNAAAASAPAPVCPAGHSKHSRCQHKQHGRQRSCSGELVYWVQLSMSWYYASTS